MLAFREPPDYEEPRSASSENVYRVTIEAGGGAHDVSVTVTDLDEPRKASMDRPQPRVGRPLGAVLSDDDQRVTAESWQWARSRDGAAWTDIEGATSPRRSPSQDDEGMFLRVPFDFSV